MWRDRNSLTIAIAPNAAVGAICASYSGRHSRLFLWDTDTDTFTPGQFLQGRSVVLDISPDGRHIAYYAESFHKDAKSYIGIAHPPYYTALAFFPACQNAGHHANFTERGELNVAMNEPGWWGEGVSKDPRVEPGCPYEIVRRDHDQKYCRDVPDARHHRQVWADGLDLYAQANNDTDPKLLRSFPREDFIAIAPPDWAKVW